MKMKGTARIFFVCLAIAFPYVTSSSNTNSSADTELVAVFISARHGDRTPQESTMSFYPDNPYVDFDFYPVGYGGLTNIGKERAYLFGKYLRERYSSLLSELYIPSEITVASTTYDRTVMTAQSALAGLYEPVEEQKFVSSLNWQPIPVWPKSEQSPEMYFKNCNRYYEEVVRIILFNALKFLKYSDLHKTLSNYTGGTVLTPVEVYSIQDIIEGQESFGLPAPDWWNSVKEEVKREVDAMWNLLYGSNLAVKLSAGALLDTILDNADKLISGSETIPKVHMFFGHDTTLAPMLKACKLPIDERPGFVSSLAIELRKNLETDEYGFEFVYINKFNASEPENVRVTGCGDSDFCEISKFKKLVSNVLVDETFYNAACFTLIDYTGIYSTFEDFADLF